MSRVRSKTLRPHTTQNTSQRFCLFIRERFRDIRGLWGIVRPDRGRIGSRGTLVASLFVGNDNDVYLQGYRLASTGAPITDALPAFNVYQLGGEDAQGNPLPGPVLSGLTNVAMSYVGANGDYRGLIPGTANLTVGAP